MYKVAYHPIYHHKVPLGHRFPMEKYDLLPLELLQTGIIKPEQLFEPSVVSEEAILYTHCPIYWEKLKNQSLSKAEIRKTGFLLSDELILRERILTQGTIDAARYALKDQIAFNIAGGTHHAFATSGEGFCLLNDQAIACNYLLTKQQICAALIIDLDVHQGNGTAHIFANTHSVFTFSMHGDKNYPVPKMQSDLDIALADNCGDEEYLNLLGNALAKLEKIISPSILFYQAGVDVLQSDQLGRLALSVNGCMKRDKMVFEFAIKNQIPCCVTMGGGYSKDLNTIIEAHTNTFYLANLLFGINR